MLKPSLAFVSVLLLASSAFADAPVNKNCPVGGESVDASSVKIDYKGKTLGFCCDRCDDAFLKWDEDRRDAFVAASVAGKSLTDGDDKKDALTDSKQRKSDLYTLNTCIVSGGELGSMGDPIVKVYDGREVRFCCGGCIERFEAQPEKFLEKADEALIKQQLPYYPLDTCVVGGDKLGEMGEPINFVHNNRFISLCCRMCEKKFKKDPESFLKKLDEAVLAKQREHYPLETCLVAGGELGSMGEPKEMIVGNRLMRLCCGGCLKKVNDDPAKFVAILDKAWAAKHKTD